jgi:hypothetical protein
MSLNENENLYIGYLTYLWNPTAAGRVSAANATSPVIAQNRDLLSSLSPLDFGQSLALLRLRWPLRSTCIMFSYNSCDCRDGAASLLLWRALGWRYDARFWLNLNLPRVNEAIFLNFPGVQLYIICYVKTIVGALKPTFWNSKTFFGSLILHCLFEIL